MKTKLKTIKAITLIMMFILTSFAGNIVFHENETTVSAARPKIISFNSYIDYEYDISPLNQPLSIDQVVSIPITVKYSTDIPDFFNIIPFPINFYILFGQPIGPMQKISLEIVDKPDWANIYISTPDVLTDIPFDSEEPEEKTVNLVFSPKIEAPAEPYTITIRASCPPIGRVNEFSYEESISFTPSFIPTIGITVDNPIREVTPHESVNFKITIHNDGNKITRVTPDIVTASEDWKAIINPTQKEIPANDDATFTFSIIAPFDFGWHNEYENFKIDFKSEVYPFQPGSANSTRSVYLSVNNYGFSTPGFEIIYIFVAIIIIGIIYKKRRI
jgi:hypothetical protein